LPRWRSPSGSDLYSAVNDLDSRGNSVLHTPTKPQQLLFPHDLPFGDSLTHLKADNIFRVGFCNIGGFPASPPPNNKAQELKTFMALYAIDVLRGSEANLNWSKPPENVCLLEWFRDIPSCRIFTAHNSTENLTHHQFGGTFWIGMGMATQHIIGSSKDSAGLGRWVVCSLASKSGKRLHLIFGYRPCQNSKVWLRSIYAQHRRHFDAIGRLSCPCAAFLSDLALFLMSRYSKVMKSSFWLTLIVTFDNMMF